MLIAAVATCTTDLSYARSIGKREAPAVMNLPIPIHIQPVSGSTFSTSNTKSLTPRQIIRKRRDAKSRRAESDDSESEDSSDDEEDKQVPTQHMTFSAKLPLAVEAEPSEYSEVKKQGYETFQSSATDLDDSFTVKEGGRRLFSEGQDYAARFPPLERANVQPSDLSYDSPPLASTYTTQTPPIDIASGLNSFIANSNPKLAFPSAANSVAADRGMKPFAVASVSKDPNMFKDSTTGPKGNSLPTHISEKGGGVNDQFDASAVINKMIGKTGNAKAEADEPEVFVSDQKENNSYKTETTAAGQSEHTKKGTGSKAEGNTEGNVVAVKKIKADGTPFIVKVYAQKPGGRGENINEDTNAVDDVSSDEEAPTATGEENVKGAIAETKPNLSDETEEHEQTEDPSHPNSTSQTSTHQPSKEPPAKKPDTKKPDSKKSDPKESDDDKLHDKELDDKELDGKEPDDKKPDQEEPNKEEHDTKKSEKESDKIEPGKEESNEPIEKKTKKEPETKEAAEEKDNKDQAPGKINHGDYTAFTPAGAEESETFSILSTETENTKFGKTTLSPKLVDLITWKGNSAEGETRDTSTFSASSSKKETKHR